MAACSSSSAASSELEGSSTGGTDGENGEEVRIPDMEKLDDGAL